MRIREHLNLEFIQIIKKPGGSMRDSYLDEARTAVLSLCGLLSLSLGFRHPVPCPSVVCPCPYPCHLVSCFTRSPFPALSATTGLPA